MEKEYLKYKGKKELVTSITNDPTNSYEILVTDEDSNGFVLVAVRAKPGMQSFVNIETEKIHIDDFKKEISKTM